MLSMLHTYICGVKRNLLRKAVAYPNACSMLDFGDVQGTRSEGRCLGEEKRSGRTGNCSSV
jgi:hypothetical protein